MKFASTLKIELAWPEGQSWSDVNPRLFALRHTAAQALTMTMQDIHADAIGEIRSEWQGESKTVRAKSKEWRQQVRNKLARNWKNVLAREFSDRQNETGAERTYMPVTDALVGETVDNILARFSGEHLKDLVALRGGFPSFVETCSFYCEGRKVEISGVPDEAKIRLPIFGTGTKTTEFALKIGGDSARAQWRKLVADFSRRTEVVEVERKLDKIRWTDAERQSLEKLKTQRKNAKSKEQKKTISDKIGALVASAKKRIESLRAPLETRLHGVTKMGRVGIVRDDRRRKWFVTVSFTQYRADSKLKGQKAALNFGINMFIQALTEDGNEWHEDGEQILLKRQQQAAIRKRIMRSMRTFGSGSRGRGKKRRELPLTKRRGDESNFVQTYNRQLAARVIEWCQTHNVADLYLEDMSGIRENFEQRTQGQAFEEVKRRFHSWPYYQSVQAIERQAAEHGIRTHKKGAFFDSQRCPRLSCKHTAPENVITVDRTSGPVVELNGQRYRQITESWTRFECQKCGFKGKGDIVTCANHLIDVGATHALEKQQEKSRERISAQTKKIRKNIDNGVNGSRPHQVPS